MKQRVTRIVLVLSLCLAGITAFAGQAATGDAPVLQNGINEKQIHQLQSKILADPQTMALIMALQDDPDVQLLLGDPSFVQAVTAGDFTALATDPRLVTLFNNSRIKEIMKRIEQQ